MSTLTLTLLHGAPGSGKSTWVRDHGLSSMTLSFDSLRFLLSPLVPALDGDEVPVVTRELGRAAIDATVSAIEARLALGQSVIVDNMNLTAKDQARHVRLARRYGARCQLVRFQEGLDEAQLIERNRHRGAKRLAEPVLRDLIAQGEQAQVTDGIEIVSGEQVIDQLYVPVADHDASSRVIVVGDVHSHAHQLAQAVADYDDPEATWIFLGDLFDRGPDPVGVVRVIEQLRTSRGRDGAVVLLRGNHDTHLERILRQRGDVPEGARTTYAQLKEGGVTYAQMLELVEQLRPVYVFRRHGTHYACSHGGVLTSMLAARWDPQRDAYRLGDLPAHLFVHGVGERSRSYRGVGTYGHIDTDLAQVGWAGAPSGGEDAPALIQLHGHRNGDRVLGPQPPLTVPEVVNLEGGVTEGGELRVAVLEAPGRAGAGPVPSVVGYPAPVAPASAVAELVALLEGSEEVRSRQVGTRSDGSPITAYNFTRKAFLTSDWRFATRAARGLFISGEEVVMRGYEKFFNMGEPHGYTREEVLDGNDFRGPVVAARKANGFLGLFGSIDGELVCYSKAGPTPYAQAARDVLDALLPPERVEALRRVLERHKVTLACEVIHHLDLHIVSEPSGDTSLPDRLIALDCIRNQVEFALDEEAMGEVLAVAGPELVRVERWVVDGRDELAEVIDHAAASRDYEGLVLRGPGGAMVKVKADYYRWVKALRGAVLRQRSTRASLARLSPDFADWVDARGGLEAVRAAYTVVGIDGGEHVDMPRMMRDFHSSVSAS